MGQEPSLELRKGCHKGILLGSDDFAEQIFNSIPISSSEKLLKFTLEDLIPSSVFCLG